MMRLCFFLHILLSSMLPTTAQTYNFNFGYPMDRSIVVTGNYGELRPNHFHAGLDFSTDPTKHLPLKSVADGYVSRIKISSGGYGKVLYVTHANGFVSVYAHQQVYAPKIDSYVKQKQTELQKNELEIYPTAAELPIKKGEIIGYSGNSGSSSAPHLHFEIREEKSEIPINPLLVYPVMDDIKPVISQLAIYNTSDTTSINVQLIEVVKNTKEGLALPKQIITLAQNCFAVGFSGFDQANGGLNKNNIYEAKLLLDNTLIYHHQLNNISFDNGRYVNVFSEKVNNQKIQKCFTPSCHNIAIYKTLSNNGRIVLTDTLPHRIELIVNDERGNTNSVSFNVKTKKLNGYVMSTKKYNAFCNKEFNTKTENVEVTIPAGTLTHSSLVGIYYNQLGKLVVGDKNENLMNAYTIKVKVPTPLKGKEKQLVLTYGNNNCLTGKYENNWFITESKAFGSFAIDYDSIAPKMIQLHAASKKKGKTPTNHSNTLRVKVSDNLSGIGDYHVYMNNTWTIAEYDAKTSTISCEIAPNTTSISVDVIDRVGNKSTLKVR